MQITISDSDFTIHIKNDKTKKKFLNFIKNLEESELKSNHVEYFDQCDRDYIQDCEWVEELSIRSKLTKPIDLSNYFNLKKISLGDNIKLFKLPDNLEEIIFYGEFDYPIDNLPNGIKKINFSFGSKFNQPMNNLPLSLEELILGIKYSYPLDYLPESLKILRICNKSIINYANLPIGLEKLYINGHLINFKNN